MVTLEQNVLLFLKKQNKSVTISWTDDDESEGDGERESTKHIAALSSRVVSDAKSGNEDLAYDELPMSHITLSIKNTNTCKQLEEQEYITNKLEDERVSHQAKISELNNKVTLLNSQFSHVMKQVKLCSTGTNNPTLSERMLSHSEKGDVLMGDVKTKENSYSWTSQRKSQTANLTGMLSTMLEHQVTPKELGILHLDSINNERGDVLMKGTINDCFQGISQQEPNEKQSRMLHTM